VAGNCHVIRNDDSVRKTLKASFINRRHLIECWRYWGNLSTLPAPSTFIRKEVFNAVGGFDETEHYAMDHHHWIKITDKFEVKTIDVAVARFRYDDGSISYSRQQQQWAETLAISKKYWGSRFSLGYYQLLLSYLWYSRGRNISNRLPYRLHRAADWLVSAICRS
jgi:hypothetical protein